MPVKVSRLSRVAVPRVLPDRGACGFCVGPFSTVTLKSGLRPEYSAIPYRRAITGTGERDGAQEADGG
jgi:hypothetical protein